jgi:hypothetical protein
MAKSDRPSDMANDIIGAIRAGTKKWTSTKKSEERSPASRTYRSHCRSGRIKEIVDRAISDVGDDDITIPEDLESRILDQLKQNPSWRWDAAVAEVAGADHE